ncbi:MAG: DUF1513 domain-containing protein, partial [Bdellovibrionota bacterium]
GLALAHPLLNAAWASETTLPSPGGLLLIGMKERLAVLNVDKDTCEDIKLPNSNPHSQIFSPQRPNTIFVIDQLTPHLSLVDLSAKKWLRAINADENYYYSGHGCFSPDGARIFLGEFHTGTGEGRISVYDTTTYKLEGRFASHGLEAHNMLLLKSGVLVVVHHGFRKPGRPHDPIYGGSISFLDSASGKLIEHHAPENPYWALSHLDATADDEVYVSMRTWYRLDPAGQDINLAAPLYYGKQGGQWKTLMPPAIAERMRLSLTTRVDQLHNRLFVAHADGHLVSVWDLAKREVIKLVEFGEDKPMGLEFSADGRHVLVSTANTAIHFLSRDSLERARVYQGQRFHASAPHITLATKA